MSKDEHLQQLSEIRNLMEKSSRFLSLSGLSGIFAGIFALIGAFAAYVYFNFSFFYPSNRMLVYADTATADYRNFLLFFFIDGLSVLILAVGFGIFFSWRKAQKNGFKLWDKTTKRLLINLFIPLVVGGLFVLSLVYHGYVGIVSSVTLIFYGLALINASRDTFRDVRFLGISEIILGIISSFYLGYGLFFWTLGFGVLHIVYGSIMYFRYEAKK